MNTILYQLNGPNYYQLGQLWKDHEKYIKAFDWVKKFDDSSIRFVFDRGMSCINGTAYPSFIYFKEQEDFLAFKMAWGSLLKF